MIFSWVMPNHKRLYGQNLANPFVLWVLATRSFCFTTTLFMRVLGKSRLARLGLVQLSSTQSRSTITLTFHLSARASHFSYLAFPTIAFGSSHHKSHWYIYFPNSILLRKRVRVIGSFFLLREFWILILSLPTASNPIFSNPSHPIPPQPALLWLPLSPRFMVIPAS